LFKLFTNNNDTTQFPIKHYSRFDLIKRRYLEELDTIKTYYRNKDRAVDNRHILNRIITLLAPNVYLDNYEYYKIVTASSELLSKQFDIVSNLHSGKIHDNLFFGNNSKEILLYTDSGLDPYDIEDNWIDIPAVRVIYTEDTDLSMNIPFNNNDYIVPVLHVMTIDINLMLLQYKYWAIQRIDNDMGINPNVFISQIVLPNMLDNMLDLAIYNRFNSLLQGFKIESNKFNHPFHVLDYSKGIDNILKKVIKDVKNTNIDIIQLYKTIPTIVNDNMYQALQIRKDYFTKQSEWVLFVSRIPTIYYTLLVLGEKGIKRNKDKLTRLPAKIKQIERSKTLESKLQHEVVIDTELQMQLDYIESIVGKR